MKIYITEDSGFAIGAKFGKWEIIGPRFRIGASYCVVVKCDCTVIVAVRASSLLDGRSKGCRSCADNVKIQQADIELVRAKPKERGRRPKKKRLTDNPLYGIFCNIKKRCYSTYHKQYKDYGGRGIQICEAWLTEPKAFIDWAESHGWKKSLQIDRIDNDGNYSPDNCRFVTPRENSNNRRSNHRITAFGETKTAKMWERDSRCQASQSCFLRRIKRGVLPEMAITTISEHHHYNWKTPA